MAIVQISQITNRKGLQVDLPQLAGAELGWSTDTRQLYIGNGTLQEGAPVIGNTEILTEFSDILAINSAYTYKGADAGYIVQTGPVPGTPIVQNLQTWLDQFATVKDFGAVGDGVADDTAAINRALYQLYCRESNPQIRRSLFFPAGVYRVTSTINIPPYATLYGEGIKGSVICMDAGTGQYVAQTADSLQQTGVTIGTNGATPPQSITITNLGFQSLDLTKSIFSVTAASICRFQNVSFMSPLQYIDLQNDSAGSSCVEFFSTTSLICNQIVFDGCLFTGASWGINTSQQIQGITITNSEFNLLYRGIVLGIGTSVNGGPTGVRITSNLFDNIYSEGIVFGNVSLNASGHNIFYDVGNYFQGISNPFTAIINIQNSNNISISDMFARPDNASNVHPRIQLNNTTSIATTNGVQLSLGSYVIQSGQVTEIINDTTATVCTIDTTKIKAFNIIYTIIRDTSYRTGTIVVATASVGTNLVYSEDFVENVATYYGSTTTDAPGSGVALSVTQVANSTTAYFQYTASDAGYNGSLTYSINYLA